MNFFLNLIGQKFRCSDFIYSLTNQKSYQNDLNSSHLIRSIADDDVTDDVIDEDDVINFSPMTSQCVIFAFSCIPQSKSIFLGPVR